MKDHKPKRGKWSHSLIKRSGCRYTNGRLHSLPLQRFSFVGQGSSLEALPPCSCKVKRVVVEDPLSRVGHTQVAAFGAFSKTGGRRGSYAPFGHIGSRVRPQQRQRWRVEMCIFEWCGVVIGGLIEPSAGSRQWWNPGFSRVEKVACR